jgi:PAS domain S-box-containing protein
MARSKKEVAPPTTHVAHTELARVQEALRVSEAGRQASRTFFEKSFHASPALMTIAHVADGRLIEVNPAFLRGSGYTREEVLGRSTLELGLWGRPSDRDEFIRRMQEQGIVRDFESDFRAKSGDVRTMLLNADLIEIGGPPCMLTVAVDITERRRREQVQDATYRISQAVLAAGDLLSLFGQLYVIIGGLMPARNFYIALLSADGTEVSFPYFIDERVDPPPPRPLANGFTEYVLQTGKPVLATAAELPGMLSARGEYHALEHRAAQRLGAPLLLGGRALGVIALQDYTNEHAYDSEDLRLLTFVAEQAAVAVHRRQAEDAMKAAEERYRGIFENSPEGLYVSSPAGKFLSANRALARMFGYRSPEEMLTDINDIGRQIYVKSGRRDEFFGLIKRGDEVTDFESEVIRHDGKKLWISESVRIIRNPAGEIIRFEGVAIDITQKREAARALQAAKDAADAASREKSHFLASVSHELRTPLNGILGYTQILRRDPALADKQREGVRVIHESAEHLLVLINDVLDLSKIEAGRIELHPVDFHLADFAAAAERVFAPRAREKNLLLETALAPALPVFVRGDEARLRQIVFNLLSNAVKFTARGGVVFSIEARAGEVLRFSVSDTGRGIADADLRRIFEPFTQVGEVGTSASGTGLGLAISRSLVEKMGGHLNVESRPGWGSRFWFEVPLPTATSATPRTVTAKRISGYDGERKRILIVDDNTANRGVMDGMLAPLGFEIRDAADGASGLAAAEEFKPDLVLMDLRLPGGIDGLEATRRLRAGPRGKELKIVAVSASAYDIDQRECREAGCDDFLAKPFREEELWDTIGRALKLTWQISDEDRGTISPSALLEKIPSASELDTLHEFARKGDIMGLRARLEALAASDLQLIPFTNALLELAGRFKMKAIRQYLERHRASASP